ncbi:dTDP-4-dehydrorhamnose 3,5-epimerase [Acidilobus saccharovorans 345-15]|uniref:dTDP-4-dehydrorhamnose 3,5-epimerase n=1 Tax=Acidilobus saccharovorans (strain DSM 16705 / JCM 18335 / VKM B-2471 / 345-15) TaxID=666510 RepID=D9Q176_ACIS3|nr:dTDP-4-dehydrorhamnose 3,5-epimerase [Acidilobus saccharovorans]ADL19064.1 dTDP-4-dehydrorhamnose 3,5-epimerase [Acidilobus saccharovorans 345-15]
MPFEFERLDIPDVVLVKPKVFRDQRGYFMETFVAKAFEQAGVKFNVVQENQSYSRRGVIRGLHYQRGQWAQAKIVRAVKGEIYDVAVDIRPWSPTFGKHVAVRLSEDNGYALYIPRGFAHGFQVLSEYAIVVYLVDNDYAPQAEGGIRWDDSDIAISWPISGPVLSEKDARWPTLREALQGGFIP